MAGKFDLYAHITDAIVRALEAGTPPWRKPWTGAKGGAAFPLRHNGEPYQGINVIMLWLEAAEKGFTSPFWMTYRQAQELDAQVRKGAKSSTVVKIGRFEKEDEDGETTTRGYARAYRVFNADQIEGLPEKYHGAPIEEPRDLGTVADPALDAFFAATGARIETSEDPRAYYNPVEDRIHMPPIATFHGANGYYATLAHEAVHWTGHGSRLDRLSKGRDRRAYAFEELIAEIGACMVCASLGLEPEIDQSAAYVESWLKALKDDKRLIFTAASAAQAACNLILERGERHTEDRPGTAAA